MATETPPSQPGSFPWNEAYSPNRTYRVQCDEAGIRIYRGNDMQLVGQTDIQASEGCFSVQWSQDETKVSIVSEEGLYVWHVTAAAPQRIGQILFGSATWSPDGERLAIGRCDMLQDQAFAIILSASGNLLMQFKIGGCGATWPGYLFWLNNDTIVDPLRYGSDLTVYEYYNATSGKNLGFYYRETYFSSVQPPQLSPDGRWHVVEEARNSASHPVDMLYDLQMQEGFPLSDIPGVEMRFLSWSPDSTIFYLVSRPMDETAASSANTPFGFLALDPHTRQFKQLFEQAMDARFGNGQRLAWVVYPVMNDAGKLGLAGGMFDLETSALLGRHYVSDRLVYSNPATGDLIPAAWSNDGSRLVYADSDGRIVLLNTNGSMQEISSGMPETPWPNAVYFAWSSDDRRFFAQYDDQVWVVTVPDS